MSFWRAARSALTASSRFLGMVGLRGLGTVAWTCRQLPRNAERIKRCARESQKESEYVRIRSAVRLAESRGSREGRLNASVPNSGGGCHIIMVR
jgi:hypothetical protein